MAFILFTVLCIFCMMYYFISLLCAFYFVYKRKKELKEFNHRKKVASNLYSKDHSPPVLCYNIKVICDLMNIQKKI